MSYSSMTKLQRLGSGTYGVVYKAKSNPPEGVPSLNLAIKRNIIDQNLDFIGSVSELDILIRLRNHPNIVRLDQVCYGDPFKIGRTGALSPLRNKEYKDQKDDKIHFVFECANGSLYHYIYKERLETKQFKKIFLDCLLALEFIHSEKIIHRDIKPENFLIFKEDNILTAKLCDFGMAKPMLNQGDQTPRVTTAWYRAPEVFLQTGYYDYGIDIWSLGLVFWECIVGYPLFQRQKKGENDLDFIKSITGHEDAVKKKNHIHSKSNNRESWKDISFGHCERYGKFGFSPGSKDQFLNLLSRMIVYEPADRWSASKLLDHEFFESGRNKIIQTRSHLKQKSESQIIIHDCVERKWAINIAFEIFDNRQNFASWYKPRTVFQAIDMFDRYLNYKINQKRDDAEAMDIPSLEKGLIHSKDEVEIRFYACFYLAIKYFNMMTTAISFYDLVPQNLRNKEAKLIADQFETDLIYDIFENRIYRETIFEVADANGKILDAKFTSDLLAAYGNISECQGKSAEDLYQLFINEYSSIEM